MPEQPLRTTVVGSYPFPSWLEYATQNLDAFGTDEMAELQEDAVIVAIHDQMTAGLDVITDGEQTRLDFNLSFYGFIEGLGEPDPPRRNFGPPAHDQRGKHEIIGDLTAPNGLGAIEEFIRLQRLAPSGVTLKASVPGPYTLSGRLKPNRQYPDRWAITEALLPLVRQELEDLVAAGCTEITVDEPSMSCYAYREDPVRFVDIFTGQQNRSRASVTSPLTSASATSRGHAVSDRRYAPMFPAFLDMKLDEIHVEMASREFGELAVIEAITKTTDVAVGIVDVKSYFVESPEDIAERVRRCLDYAPADRLSFAPDCGLSQTARWAAKQKLVNMVAGVQMVRDELGV